LQSRLFHLFATAVLLFLACVPLLAHHGTPSYDLSKMISAKATVTSLEWNNPHCLLHFDIKDGKGAVRNWAVEMYNPLYMSRAGWNKDTLKSGDEIEVSFHPSKNGSGNGIVRIGDSKIVFRGVALSLDEDNPVVPPGRN